MKWVRRTIVLTFLCVMLQSMGCAQQVDVTLTIHEDGSAVLTSVSRYDRRNMERQIQQAARRQAHSNDMLTDYFTEKNGWSDDTAPGEQVQNEDASDAQQDNAVATEDDPEAKFKQEIGEYIRTQDLLLRSEKLNGTIENINLEENMIHIQTNVRFATLQDMVDNISSFTSTTGFTRMKFDKTEEGNLRMTLVSGPARMYMLNQLKNAKRQMTIKRAAGSMRIVMPGDILESPFPDHEGNTTTLSVSLDIPDSFENVNALYKNEEIVFVSLPGKLNMDAFPLGHSQKSSQSEPDPEKSSADNNIASGRESQQPDATVSPDVAGDFLVVPLGVKIKSVHYFPEAAQYANRLPQFFMQMNDGANECSFSARIHAPQGRKIHELSEIKLIRAVDDLGNTVKTGESPGSFQYHHYDDEDAESRQFSFSLDFPKDNARAIESLDGQAIVTTFLGWNEHVIVNPRASKQNVDVSHILPGTTVVIEKVRKVRRNDDDIYVQRQGYVVLRIEGPKSVKDIDIKLDALQESFDSYVEQEQNSTRSGKSIRRCRVSYHTFSENTGPPQLRLTLRVPHGFKRDRVKFTLTGLDLF